MIEGLRLLPWFYEAARRDPDSMVALKSCTKCMEMNPDNTRREMGCGYLPPLERRLPLWEPAAFPDGEPSACTGYLVRLPGVVEVARAYAHWSKGELASFCGGAAPHELLVLALEILNGSVNDLNLALMTPANKGGLGS